MQQIIHNNSLKQKPFMRKIGLFILLASFVFSACSDNGCKPVKPEAEEPQITAYAAANGITAMKHHSGLHYQVVNQGSGPTPTYSSKVYVTYTGKRLDGSVFDQATSPVGFTLGGLIEGWQIGLQLIQKGGSIRLIVPSSLAYGCLGSGPITPNSILYFDIHLVDVQ